MALWDPNATSKEIYVRKGSKIEFISETVDSKKIYSCKIIYIDRSWSLGNLEESYLEEVINENKTCEIDYDMFIQSIISNAGGSKALLFLPNTHTMLGHNITIRGKGDHISIGSNENSVDDIQEMKTDRSSIFTTRRSLGKGGPLLSAYGVDLTLGSSRVEAQDFIDLGISFLDCGLMSLPTECYESFAFEGFTNSFISMSFGFGLEFWPDTSPQSAFRIVDLNSLRRFRDQVDTPSLQSSLDLLICASFIKEVPIEKAIKIMAQLVKEEKVKYLGLANVSAEALRRAHKVHPISAVQIDATVLALGVGNQTVDLLQTCRELEIAILVNKVDVFYRFAKGFYFSEGDDSEDVNGYVPQFSKENLPKAKELSDQLGPFTNNFTVDLLFYLFGQGPNTFVFGPPTIMDGGDLLPPYYIFPRSDPPCYNKTYKEIRKIMMALRDLQEPCSEDLVETMFFRSIELQGNISDFDVERDQGPDQGDTPEQTWYYPSEPPEKEEALEWLEAVVQIFLANLKGQAMEINGELITYRWIGGDVEKQVVRGLKTVKKAHEVASQATGDIGRAKDNKTAELKKLAAEKVKQVYPQAKALIEEAKSILGANRISDNIEGTLDRLDNRIEDIDETLETMNGLADCFS